jgi:hypothetical protein
MGIQNIIDIIHILFGPNVVGCYFSKTKSSVNNYRVIQAQYSRASFITCIINFLGI